ncbi:MAG: ABC transporter ATP-binding protein [Chloroflexi bacterium]|nr:ABC transporter ATP-binding protein [Chloroflexota bacterium]
MIELQQIEKIYPNPARNFIALKDVTLSIQAGEFISIMGKSGSGKSTLLNMISGIDRPTSGTVRINDVVITELPENEMAKWRGEHIGIVFQFFQLLPTLTVIENVMLPMDLCKVYSWKERKERAMDLLEQMDMVEHASKFPSALSGGQQQRVAIARALANDPPIILADEPTGNLDSETAEAIIQIFENQHKRNKTVLIVTHDFDLAARAQRTVVLTDGRVSKDSRREHG